MCKTNNNEYVEEFSFQKKEFLNLNVFAINKINVFKYNSIKKSLNSFIRVFFFEIIIFIFYSDKNL